jgi:limonene-1,2-epoxide hydrolase
MTNQTMMSTLELAQAIKQCVQAGDAKTAYTQYFTPDMVSAEGMAGPDGNREMTGLEASLKKAEMWNQMMETHQVEISEPLVAENHFVLKYRFDVTNRQSGNRGWMEELGVYTVNNGKIVREEFFYTPNRVLMGDCG